jgi:CheY-like chemotaxis protein
LEITQRAIEDVAATVGRMREFYRQRKPDLEPFSVDLNQLAIQTAELTRARWSDMPQQRGVVIDLQTQLDPGLPAVVGVESEIREAMTNLIFNAVDAMPEGGTLTLRTSRHDGTPDRGMRQEVTFEVIDSGVGMDEATRLRCLEPFFTTKGDRGTGLGLAMVYGIAERHNAELEIDSSPDNGTTVRLRFALASVETPAAGPSIQVPRGLSILAIDDEPNLLQALRELLMGDGHTVVTAEGGRQGIEQFRNSPSSFSVVITDLGMPHLDGHMVAQEIRRLRPDMPVILLTGWGHRLSAEADSSPNVDLVLGKPPKVGELRAALAQLCGLGSGVEEHRTKMDHPDGVSF